MSSVAGDKDGQFLFENTSQATASLVLACLSFAVGIWIALPRNTSWRQIVFSYLMSSGHNPAGHLYAASGVVISTFFLIPVSSRLRYAFPRTYATHCAAILFIIGIGALAFMGTLAFAIDGLGGFHDDVTTVSLFGILGSMLLYLYQTCRSSRGKTRLAAATMIPTLLATTGFLVYVFVKPDYVGLDTAVWHSLAVLEWAVVTFIAICLFLLLFFSTKYQK